MLTGIAALEGIGFDISTLPPNTARRVTMVQHIEHQNKNTIR
jgi:hypothetical protein